MTNDIREKAEAFINYIDTMASYNFVDTRIIKEAGEYLDLRAALCPSKEEIAKQALEKTKEIK